MIQILSIYCVNTNSTSPVKLCFAFLTCCLPQTLPWRRRCAAEQCAGSVRGAGWERILNRGGVPCLSKLERGGCLHVDAANAKPLSSRNVLFWGMVLVALGILYFLMFVGLCWAL